MACELGGDDGRSLDFKLSLWLPIEIKSDKNVVFGTYPPDVDLGVVKFDLLSGARQ
jgi:hypothetical protein